MENKLFIQKLITLTILMAITIIAILFITKDVKDPKLADEVIQKNELSDFESLTRLTSITLIKGKESSASNKDDPDFTKYIKVNGDFARIYLYANISVDEKPLTDWDSLYIKFNSKGGHLYRPKTLSVPLSATSSALLYNMSVVPYLGTVPYSEVRPPEIINWFENAFRVPKNPNVERKVRFDTFLSTTNSGKIYEITLYYQCAQETPNCYIAF